PRRIRRAEERVAEERGKAKHAKDARRRAETSTKGVVPAGFFALRTPLLPFDEFVAWGEGLEARDAADPSCLEEALAADRARLRDRLRRAIERPFVREALFVASPSLDARLHHWIEDPDGERGQKVERVLVR